jgi:hypothetical protein
MSESQRPDPPLRDPVLDAVWKAHSTELPPPRIDAAILAAAHREARARPRAIGDDDEFAEARAPSHAWWGFAAAATIGAIAFGVVQMAPPPAPPDVPVAASDVPAAPAPERRKEPPSATPAPKAASEAAPPATPAAPTAKVSVQREPSRERQTTPPSAAADKLTATAPSSAPSTGQVVRKPAPAQEPVVASNAGPAPAAPRAFPAEPESKQETDAIAQDRGNARALAKESAALAPAMPSPKAVTAPAAGAAMARVDESSARADGKRRDEAAATPPLAPDAWVTKIVALMNAGLRDDAARELRAFRNAYPDADNRLPLSLRDWAATVKRDP